MVDTSVTPSLGYMKLVPRRDAATLLPIITAHVAPGTSVHTDEWSAYNGISSLPGVAGHSTVNHSIHFVDPSTGVHTQNVESYWNRIKPKLKRMRRCHKEMLASYLDEFIWRECHGSTSRQAFANLCRDIKDQCRSTSCYATPREVHYTNHILSLKLFVDTLPLVCDTSWSYY